MLRLSTHTLLTTALIAFVAFVSSSDLGAQQLSRSVLSSSGGGSGRASTYVSWTLGQIETAGLSTPETGQVVRTTLGFTQNYLGTRTVRSLLSIDSVAAAAGQNISFKLQLSRYDDEVTRPFGPTALRVAIAYNSTILFFNGASSGVTIIRNERLHDSGVVELQLPVEQYQRDQILSNLDFTTALGNDSISPIAIISVTPSGTNTTIETRDGLFTLLGICRDGGARLVDASTTFGISAIYPHPARTTTRVVFSIGGLDRVTMSLRDANGRDVRTLLDGHVAPGQHELDVDVELLPSGTYTLVLNSGAWTTSTPILVVK